MTEQGGGGHPECRIWEGAKMKTYIKDKKQTKDEFVHMKILFLFCIAVKISSDQA